MRDAHEARSAVVVVNTGARRGALVYDQALAHLRAGGVPVVAAHPVHSGRELDEVLVRVMADAPDLLVIGGGDGTVGSAAARVAGTDTTLGVLPLGTANDFARTLGLPGDVASACAALAHGTVVDVDLGRLDGTAYLNVASLGLSVGVTAALGPRLKRWLGPMAYPVATLRAYRRHQPFAARLVFPDGDHETLDLDDLLQVAVGNGRHYGGGNAVSPTAGIDDHVLDVYVIIRGRLLEHVSIARLLKDGSFVHHDRVVHLTTRTVRVETDRPLPVNLDGEVAGRTPGTFLVERNALHVVVPRASTAAVLDGPRARRDRRPPAGDAGRPAAPNPRRYRADRQE